MYPSDYGYSTSSTDKICDTTTMYDWNRTGTACTSWLTNISKPAWTITPFSGTDGYVFRIDDLGCVSYNTANITYSVSPVLFLKPTVKVTGGTGTSGDPYTLGL